MKTLMRALTLLAALVLFILHTMPAQAVALPSRTWVSGVGDDTNPCSRAAPCLTFSGALGKTAAGGEINCLDPGSFGGQVVITKSISIVCDEEIGHILAPSGVDAIIVNVAASDVVTLRGLDIEGAGVGLTGIGFI